MKQLSLDFPAEEVKDFIVGAIYECKDGDVTVEVKKVTPEYVKLWVINGCWEFYRYHDRGDCYLYTREDRNKYLEYEGNRGDFYLEWHKKHYNEFTLISLPEKEDKSHPFFDNIAF